MYDICPVSTKKEPTPEWRPAGASFLCSNYFALNTAVYFLLDPTAFDENYTDSIVIRFSLSF